MNSNLLNLILIGLALLAAMAVTEVIYRKTKLKPEVSRRFIHVVAGLITLAFPFLFNSHWYVLLLGLVFTLIMYISKKQGLLGSIHHVKRKTTGAIIYPAGIYLSFIAYDIFQDQLFYFIPVLLFVICDPLAAIVGEKVANHRKKAAESKSIAGSVAFFAGAVVLCLLVFYLLGQNTGNYLTVTLAVALASTLVEAVTYRGYDNLAIPVAAIAVLLIFHFYA